MSAAQADSTNHISTRLTLLLAIACGIIVANLYYAQPLVGPISHATGLSAAAAGLIVTLTQVGYGIGLLLIVPLGDIIENRLLVVAALLLSVIALIMAALTSHPSEFLLASLFIGLGSVAAQVLVPIAAHMAPESARGRVVGNVMSGLLFGIMLARPVSSMIDHLLDWRAVFAFSAIAIAILTVILAVALPSRRPSTNAHYLKLLGSMWHLLRETPILRRRAGYHAFLFGTFSLFWTTVPLELAKTFHFDQQQIALFALAGVAGGTVSPFVGRMADRGWTRPATAAALGTVTCAMGLPLLIPSHAHGALVTLFVAAILLDVGVTANLILGQRAIFALGAEVRSRLNGLYMATFFAGGAAGSAIGAWAFASAGWTAALWIAVASPIAAALYFVTEGRSQVGWGKRNAGSVDP